jgi:hypothetical protein
MSGEDGLTVRAISGPAQPTPRLIGRPGDFRHVGNQILGSAMQMTSRLRDHIERLDDGAVHAADDLAVVLRALLCPGKGNGVLHRLFRECGVSIPEVILSRPPEGDSTSQFSVGSIPTREAGAVADGAVPTPVTKWPNATVLVVSLRGDRRWFTWAAFLNAYANKWGGAHLDIVVPEHLQFIDCYGAGGLSLTGYLLRTAAMEVWLLAQQVYREVLQNEFLASLDSSDRERAIFSAEGGVSTEPRDRSDKGQLQWFYHGSDRLGLIWYVDESSNENALHLALGKVEYDVRYTPTSGSAPAGTAPVAFQGPRHRPKQQQVVVERGELKTLRLTGHIKTLAQVRAQAQSTSSAVAAEPDA